MTLKRSALKRRSPLKSKPSRSGHIPIEVRDEVRLRSGGMCELVGVMDHDCGRYASEMHHRLTRAQGGGHAAANLLHLCSEAHRQVHSHPALAYERGWLIRGGGVA